MSPQKDNFELLRLARLALERSVTPEESVEVRMQKRRQQLEASGIPESIIEETLKVEFIPGYTDFLLRQDAVHAKFSTGVESIEYRK